MNQYDAQIKREIAKLVVAKWTLLGLVAAKVAESTLEEETSMPSTTFSYVSFLLVPANLCSSAQFLEFLNYCNVHSTNTL
jgi:hypothetical protein